MQEKEKIPVYIKIINGKTVCICHQKEKGCREYCENDMVTRDRFEGWKRQLYRDRYGR